MRITTVLLVLSIPITMNAQNAELSPTHPNPETVRNRLAAIKLDTEGSSSAASTIESLKRMIGGKDTYLHCLPSCTTNETALSYKLENVTVLELLDYACTKADLVWRIDPKCIVVGSKAEVMRTASQPPAKIIHHKDLHPWLNIEYPSIPCPWGSDRKTLPHIRSQTYGSIKRSPEFCLHLRMGLTRKFSRHPREGADWATEDKENPWIGTLPEPGEVTARLHHADGTVADTNNKNPTMGAMIGRWGSMGGSVECHFPWGPNSLGDSWIEVTFPGQKYWLGVPYGFARPIAEKLCLAQEQAEEPTPILNTAKADAVGTAITWTSVEYDLDDVGNDWELSVTFSNSRPVQCSVILYTERYSERDGWSLESPSVALQILQPDGSILAGKNTSSTKPDVYRRREVFVLPQGPFPKGRFWGTLAILIDDVEHQIPVPSSVFKSGHASTLMQSKTQDLKNKNAQP